MDVLEYDIPPFKTVAWVSDDAKKVWYDRFQKIDNAMILTALNSLSNKECDMQYLVVEGVTYFKLLQLATPMEIEVSATFLGNEKQKGPVFYEVILVRKETDTSKTITGCCSTKSNQAIRKHKLKETIWGAALSTLDYQRKETTITMSADTDTSVFWQKMLTTSGTQHRCSLQCQNHLNQQTELINRMKSYGYVDEASWLQDIYSWPIEWCASHGICEIRTPVVKIAYDTDATAMPYTIQIDGTTYPKEGAPGKRFPYQKRSFLRITDSKSFKAGLHHGS